MSFLEISRIPAAWKGALVHLAAGKKLEEHVVQVVLPSSGKCVDFLRAAWADPLGAARTSFADIPAERRKALSACLLTDARYGDAHEAALGRNPSLLRRIHLTIPSALKEALVADARSAGMPFEPFAISVLRLSCLPKEPEPFIEFMVWLVTTKSRGREDTHDIITRALEG